MIEDLSVSSYSVGTLADLACLETLLAKYLAISDWPVVTICFIFHQTERMIPNDLPNFSPFFKGLKLKDMVLRCSKHRKGKDWTTHVHLVAPLCCALTPLLPVLGEAAVQKGLVRSIERKQRPGSEIGDSKCWMLKGTFCRTSQYLDSWMNLSLLVHLVWNFAGFRGTYQGRLRRNHKKPGPRYCER